MVGREEPDRFLLGSQFLGVQGGVVGKRGRGGNQKSRDAYGWTKQDC